MNQKPEKPAPGPSRSGRRAKLLAAAGALLALFVLFAPTLAGWSPLRHEVPRLRLKGYPGKIRVGSASLAWWSPVELRDVELMDADGKPFVSVERYLEERTVFAMLFDRDDPPRLRVEKPRITLALRADGSNAEDLLKPVLNRPPRRPRDRTVDVVDGTLTSTDAVSGQTETWNRLALHLQAKADPSAASALHLEFSADKATDLSSLDATWQGGAASVPRTVQLRSKDLPLSAFRPLVARKAPGLDLGGVLNGTVHLDLPVTTGDTSGYFGRLDVDLLLQNVEAAWPQHLAEDRVSLSEVKLGGLVAVDSEGCDISRLTITSDVGQLGGRGTLPLSADEHKSDGLLARLGAADFDLHGSLDLAKVAHMLPHTLRLRDGLEMTQGELRVVATGNNADQPHWKGRLETTNLAARLDGRELAWEQPVTLTFEAHRDGDRLVLDALKGVADFFDIVGQGDSEKAHISARGDLDRLAGRLGQFIDLGDARLAGQAGVEIDFTRTPERHLAVSAVGTLEKFHAAFGTGTPWEEPRLVTKLDCELTEEQLHLREVHSCRLTVEGDHAGDLLSATLAGPVLLSDRQTESKWDVSLSGDLARWRHRWKPLGILRGCDLEGSVQAQTKLAVSRDAVAIDGLSAQVKSLRMVGHGLDVTEPEATLTTSAKWESSARRLSIPHLALDGALGTAAGTDLVVSLPRHGTANLTGVLKAESDLDRFNGSEADGQRPWSGRVRAELNFARNNDATTGQWQIDVDDLLIRRKVTTMVERRRGEIEQIPGPTVQIPQPPPGARLDGRARRDFEKAQRDAEKELKRQQKAARKRAEEIVLVPVPEWKTLWADKRLRLAGGVQFDERADRCEIDRVEIDSAGIRLTAKGHIADFSQRAEINLAGETLYDLEQLLARFPGDIARYVHLTGKEARPFSLAGPLRSVPGSSAQGSGNAPVQHAAASESDRAGAGVVTADVQQAPPRPQSAPPVPRELTGAAALGWRGGNLFGLQAGPGEFNLRLADDVLKMQPLDMALSGGRLKLAPQVILGEHQSVVLLPAGPLVENVELSQEVCEAWLKYVAPIMSEATRVEGRFSVALNESRLPIGDPLTGQFGGRLQIHTAQVLPGALFGQLADMIAQVQSAVGLGPRDLIGLDKPLVQISDQTVEFKLHERRIYHSPLAFNVRNVLVRTRGSVGADQTLDLVAEIHFPAEWAQRARFLSRLVQKPLEIPIRGTLRHPDLDGGAIAGIATEIGGGLLDGLLNGSLRGLFDRND